MFQLLSTALARIGKFLRVLRIGSEAQVRMNLASERCDESPGVLLAFAVASSAANEYLLQLRQLFHSA